MPKSFLFRVFAIASGVLLFVAFFAFSTFFYSPFESDLEVDLAALAPRDVDFFAARADLEGVIGEFPRLRIEPELLAHPAVVAWADSRPGRELGQQIQTTFAQLKAQNELLPFGMQLHEVFGGEDLAVAGYFGGADLAAADWVVYGRTNWLGKLGAAAVRHPGLIGLEKQGFQVRVEEQFTELKGSQLPRTLYIGRIRDVALIATKPELVQAAFDLQSKSFADSFYQSASYHDWIQNAERSSARDELELYLNTRKLLENLRIAGPLPNTASQDFAPALLGRMFQLPALKHLMGTLSTQDGLQADLHGEFSSEKISDDMQRLYRLRGFEKADFDEVARYAPRNTGLFAYFHAPVSTLLRMTVASMEPAMRQNLEDTFRNTGRYPKLEALIDDLDKGFKDRFALVVRPNDYPEDPAGPPHNKVVVPAIGLILWSKDQGTIDSIRDLIGSQGPRFGLKGRNKNEAGYYKYQEAGYQTFEFWSELIDGTGVIVMAKSGEVNIITNSIGMLGHMIKTFSVGDEKYPRLSEDPRFTMQLQTGLESANFGLWLNPSTITPILRQTAAERARLSIRVDYASLRPIEERKLLDASYGGRKLSDLSPDERVRFDAEVNQRLDGMQAQVMREQLPALMGDEERWFKTAESLDGALLLLRWDPKSVDLSLRSLIPLKR
jgi:hypothetical protein